jgi:signal transduction histidine kinase
MPQISRVLSRLEAAKLVGRLREEILTEWEKRCRATVPAAREVGRADLRDSLPLFIDRLILTFGSADPSTQAEANSEIAREHGEDRANQAEYTLDEMIFEYHVLRTVLMRRLDAEGPFDAETNYILHEFIDRGIRKATVRYVALETEREKLRKIEIQASVEKLEQERDLRERFVDTLTHDLRTPLTAAKISAQFLLRKAEDPEGVRNLANRITASVGRAEKMIRDLLDANRIKAGGGMPVQIQEFNFADIVEAALWDLRQLNGPRFEFINEAAVTRGYWDSDAVQRVVENLASNAIKYGKSNTPVTIRLRGDRTTIELSVHNFGNPIAKADQATLFKAYRRTEAAIRSGEKGWGIGLTLVKAITDAHHGSVEVLSDAENGTTFVVRLPIDSREGA